MSRTINRIELLGRVGTEPELRQTRNGTAPGSGPGARPPRRSVSTSRRATGSTPRVGSARQLGGPGRPAPPDDRGPRERGRLPRLAQWQWPGQRTPVRRRPTLLVNHHPIRRLFGGTLRGRSPTNAEGGPAWCPHSKETRDDYHDRIHPHERRTAGAAQAAARSRLPDPGRGRAGAALGRLPALPGPGGSDRDLDDQDCTLARFGRLARDGLHQDRGVRVRARLVPAARAVGTQRANALPTLLRPLLKRNKSGSKMICSQQNPKWSSWSQRS